LTRIYLNNSTIDGAAIADAFFDGVRDNHLLDFISIENFLHVVITIKLIF
jgi:hypothetical protein